MLKPQNVLFEIALHLDYDNLSKYCRTSKKFAQICNNPSFWQQKSKLDFPGSVAKSKEDYHKIYLVRHCLPGAENINT